MCACPGICQSAAHSPQRRLTLQQIAGREISNGNLRQATWLLNTCQKSHQAADPEVYSQLITAFASRRLMREALSWMNAARAMDLELDAAAFAAVDLHQSRKDVGPREELDEEGHKKWWRTVSRMREGGLLEGTVGRDALLYLQKACQSRLKVQATVFQDAIRGFRDDPDSAAECLQCASKLRLEQEASTFHSVIMKCCMHGLLDKAAALVDTMAECGLQPASDIYRALCHGQALRHNETGVEFWLSKLEDAEMELAPFRLMSYHRAAKGKAESSEAWLERAHEAALHPDVACYNEVLAAFSRPNKGCATEWALPAKRADGAWRCFQQMRHKAVEPDAGSHRSVLRGFARCGLTRRSVEWMQQMLDANVAVDETCYNSMLFIPKPVSHSPRMHHARMARRPAAFWLLARRTGRQHAVCLPGHVRRRGRGLVLTSMVSTRMYLATQCCSGETAGARAFLETPEVTGERMRLKLPYAREWSSARTARRPFLVWEAGQVVSVTAVVARVVAVMAVPAAAAQALVLWTPWQAAEDALVSAGVPAAQMQQMAQAMAAFASNAKEDFVPENPNVEERYYGVIRDYNESQGFGFIECEDAKWRYGMDVFIHRRQMFGLAKGDEVSFVIVRNSQGQPQARHVIKKEETARILEKRKDREKREAEKLQAKKQADGSGLARAREAALASTWLQRMVVDKLEADEVSFNAVISSHLGIGDWKKAAQWLKRMVIRDLTPVRTHYNEVIDHCVQEGELDKAYSWLTLMKELDSDAVGKYALSIAIQLVGITTFFTAIDSAVKASGVELPDWAVFALFFGMSLRSRIFSPLDNSRPDIQKATQGQATGGFNDRTMPSWTPPGFFFPIMWILIVAPLRAASSMMIWQQVGHLCDATILVLMLHLCVGDTWNTVNNVERRLGAAVPGVLCVWASALAASYAYFQVDPFAGQLLLPTCLWLTVAAALVTDTWRVNNTSGAEPLFPHAVSLSSATPPSLPDLVSYHHLISGAAALGKEKQAEDWFGEMRCARLTPDPVFLTDVIHGFARSTEYEVATTWLRRMAKEAVHPTVACYNALISACARQGDLQRAEHWFEQLPIQRLQPDEFSYKALIRGCCLLDETQKAKQWLQKLQSTRCRPDMPFYLGMIDARGHSSFPEAQDDGNHPAKEAGVLNMRPFPHRQDRRDIGKGDATHIIHITI
eukprot:s923_g22.t1